MQGPGPPAVRKLGILGRNSVRSGNLPQTNGLANLGPRCPLLSGPSALSELKIDRISAACIVFVKCGIQLISQTNSDHCDYIHNIALCDLNSLVFQLSVSLKNGGDSERRMYNRPLRVAIARMVIKT